MLQQRQRRRLLGGRPKHGHVPATAIALLSYQDIKELVQAAARRRRVVDRYGCARCCAQGCVGCCVGRGERFHIRGELLPLLPLHHRCLLLLPLRVAVYGGLLARICRLLLLWLLPRWRCQRLLHGASVAWHHRWPRLSPHRRQRSRCRTSAVSCGRRHSRYWQRLVEQVAHPAGCRRGCCAEARWCSGRAGSSGGSGGSDRQRRRCGRTVELPQRGRRGWLTDGLGYALGRGALPVVQG